MAIKKKNKQTNRKALRMQENLASVWREQHLLPVPHHRLQLTA